MQNIKYTIMADIRINEALAFARLNGKKIMKKELAAKLFPNSTTACQQVCFTKICNGNMKRFDPAWVDIICEETGVSPNFLFGYEL